MTLGTKSCDNTYEKILKLIEATGAEGEKPLGKEGRKIGKKWTKVIQNDSLFSLFLHNWKERILLGANKNTNNKFLFLCVLDIELNMLDCLQSTYLQEPWVNCPDLPCKAESSLLCPSVLNCLMQETEAGPDSNYSLCFPSLFVLLSVYPHSLERWEMLFIFWKLLAMPLSLWFPEEWLHGVSEQLLRADGTRALNLFPLQ